MNLLQKVKKTMLLTKEQKEKILNSKLDENKIKSLEEFFNKYEKNEIAIWSKINKQTTSIILKIIKDIEKKDNDKTLEELKQIEQKLKEL